MNKKQLVVVLAAVVTALSDAQGTGTLPQEWAHYILLATTIISALLPAIQGTEKPEKAEGGE